MITPMACERARARAVGLALAVLISLAGCSQQSATQDDLDHALVESHSALVTARIAIDTLHSRRTTSAAAQTAVEDMGQQIADAAHALEPVSIRSSDDQADRDLALAAIDTGEAALLTARDELKARGDADPAPLDGATQQIDRALDQIRGGR
jgi:hypothetical protein